MPEFDKKVAFQNAHVQGESDLALRIVADWNHGARRMMWIPKSQIDDDSEVWEPGQSGELVTSEWIAIEKDLV